MKAIVREHFETEIRKAQAAIEAGDFEAAWRALQRAHILGQTYPWPHAIAHWNMLKLAWREHSFKEVVGQLMPTVLAIPLTFVFGRWRSLRGGRVKVKDSERGEIPADLLQILNQKQG